MCISKWTFEMYQRKKSLEKRENPSKLIVLVVKRHRIKFNFVSNRNYLSVPTAKVFDKRVTRIAANKIFIKLIKINFRTKNIRKYLFIAIQLYSCAKMCTKYYI